MSTHFSKHLFSTNTCSGIDVTPISLSPLYRFPVQVSPLNERLREVQGAKMLVDVVKTAGTTLARQLKKVVQFVCGDALVCETIKDARSIAFDGPQRLKVCLCLCPCLCVCYLSPLMGKRQQSVFNH